MLRLEVIRKQRGLSQVELAERTSVTQSYISHLENGKKQPSFEKLVALAEALHCSLDELAGRSAIA